MPSYLVTGANRGLGFALVKALAADPANTVLGLVRDTTAAEARLAKENIRGVRLLAADVTDGPALKAAADEARALLGDAGLDVLINNAAYQSQVTALTSLADHEGDLETVLEDTRKSMEINVLGSLQATSAFLGLVKQGQAKKVVFISSGMSDIDLINEVKMPYAVPYSMSKGALNVLAAKLNAAYADQGLLFLSICPGVVDTTEGPAPDLPDALAARLADFMAKLGAYGGHKLDAAPPDVAAARVLAAVHRQSLSGGFGGTFRSHNGTTRWL